MARNKEDIIKLLKNPLFEGMTKEILDEVASAVQEEVKPAGSKIFRQNEEGEHFYIIEKGRVRVYRESETGIEIDLNELGPGDDFGEIALVTDRPRTATVEALEETHLLVLSKEQFDNILENHPRIYANVAKYLSDLLDKDESAIVSKQEKEHKAPELSLINYVVILAISVGIALIYNYLNPNKINILPEFYDSEAFAHISLSMAKEKFDSKQAVFIDARPNIFFNQRHIENAINLPLPNFDIDYLYLMNTLFELEEDQAIIIYGRSISAYYDYEVAEKLDLRGHKNILILKDGFSEWKKAGYPIKSE